MAGKKILIVEDNDMNLKLYQYILKSFQAEILIARDGHKGLELILNEKPDLVILDIQIPGISGIDVAKKVRKNPEYDNVILLAVTAYSMKEDREKILDAGCNYYISKPIDTRKFSAIVRDLLDGKKPEL